MPFRGPFRHFAAAAGVIAAVAMVAFVSVHAMPSADPRMAFRRPKLVGVSAADDDPVWRLGQRLFFDKGLSGSKHMACVTCHDPAKAWSNSQPRAVGDNGKALPFKAPTLLNVGTLDRLGWTGRFADTPSVSLFAMNSAATMNLPLDDLVLRLRRDPSYIADFKQAFQSDGIETNDVGSAIARYVNSITSATSRFDAWIAGDPEAIGNEAKKGFAIFVGKGRCAECHGGWTLTDGSFHDIGVATKDPGRGLYFASSVKLQHAFKTPSLRGVAERAPYMHDGSRATLDDVIDLYDKGGIARSSRADAIAPLHLTAQEKSDLKAFLVTLSGATEFVPQP